MRPSTSKPVVKIFDTDDYLNPCFSQEMKVSKQIAIDLQDMKTPAGKKVDPSHIYMVGFETDGSQAIYISSVFLSDDGENPTGIQDAVFDDRRIDDSYFDLAGRQVKNPSKGIYIHQGKKVLVK